MTGGVGDISGRGTVLNAGRVGVPGVTTGPRGASMLTDCGERICIPLGMRPYLNVPSGAVFTVRLDPELYPQDAWGGRSPGT